MRLHILSDLHLEFAHLEFDSLALADLNADVVVLAGDIHVGQGGLKWIRKQFPNVPVVYVLGNHEFYRHRIPELTETLIRETEGGRIYVLENSAVEFCGFTFLGCTLWTDFRIAENREVAMQQADRVMADYDLIEFSTKSRLLTPQDAAKIFDESINWLKRSLSKYDPARTIVVTHHAPSMKSIPPIHEGSLLNGAFVSNLDDLVASSGVPLWIHGHTHHNVDYVIGRTRVLSNQRGYPDHVCVGFDPDMVVELSALSSVAQKTGGRRPAIR